MLKFGVVGTNWITDHFIDAGRTIEGFEVAAVYSRTVERGRAFADKHGIPNVYADWQAFAASAEFDAVYVASPNALHAEQTIACLNRGKHVLCEKPIASNAREFGRMAAAAGNGVLLMEAMKSTFTPTFRAIRDALPAIGPIRRYFASYCQYSDSYGGYSSGLTPNVFDPAMSGGALLDLGVYCLYPMVALFGEPREVRASGTVLDSGADAAGALLLKYGEMDAVVHYSKMTNSYAQAEIQGELGTILFEKISRPDRAVLRRRDGSTETLTVTQASNAMVYEIEEFMALAARGETESATNSRSNSAAVLRIMDEARRQMGIRYPADANGCPICGEDNRCGNLSGAPSGSCWCMNAGFPEGIFRLVPAEERGRSCICQACLERYKNSIGG